MEPAYKLLTVEEFLDSCPNDRRHYQLFDGVTSRWRRRAFRIRSSPRRSPSKSAWRLVPTLPGCSVHSQAGLAPQGMQRRDHSETDITVTCEPLSSSYRGVLAAPPSRLAPRSIAAMRKGGTRPRSAPESGCGSTLSGLISHSATLTAGSRVCRSERRTGRARADYAVAASNGDPDEISRQHLRRSPRRFRGRSAYGGFPRCRRRSRRAWRRAAGALPGTR